MQNARAGASTSRLCAVRRGTPDRLISSHLVARGQCRIINLWPTHTVKSRQKQSAVTQTLGKRRDAIVLRTRIRSRSRSRNRRRSRLSCDRPVERPLFLSRLDSKRQVQWPSEILETRVSSFRTEPNRRLIGERRGQFGARAASVRVARVGVLMCSTEYIEYVVSGV